MADQDKQVDLEQNLLASVRAARAAWATVVISGLYYPVRLFSSVLLLAAVAGVVTTGNSWVGWLDVFGIAETGFVSAMAIAIGINFTLSIFTFIAAHGIFISFRINPWRKSLGLIVAPICLAMFSVIPILSFIDGIWIWLLYVVKSQADEITDGV